MSIFRLLLCNLFYHWRGNLAVLLGVAVGTAVLTGALLVGDSLRGSLQELTLQQLGWVDQSLVAGRFFREELGHSLPAERVSPVILLQGSASTGAGARSRASVLGVDKSFWPADRLHPELDSFWQRDEDEAALNSALAEALQVKIGDQITLSVQKVDVIPRETLLGKRKITDAMKAFTVTVRHILPESGMGRFNLKPGPQAARNAFLPLRLVQRRLALPGRVNALLVGGSGQDVQRELSNHLDLADWNLTLRTPADRARAFVGYLGARQGTVKLNRFRWQGRVPGDLARAADANGELALEQIVAYYRRHRDYLSLESGQMFLEPAVVNAARADKSRDMEESLVYLADTISDGKAEVPYAIVAGIDGTRPGDLKPLGQPLTESQIALAAWPGSPFKAKPGDLITVTYYVDDDRGSLVRKQETFVLARFFALEGKADDPDLTPQFPGITDKLDMGGWENPPFPYAPKRIKQADEDFWKRYRTTPRAYVNLVTAQKLWASRFGKLTSLRIPLKGQDAAKAALEFKTALLSQLNPTEGGFEFRHVREQALKASMGSTDFSELFVYFSFFLIAAALLLVGLLFRLNLDRRAAEVGLLLAVGFRRRTLHCLLLGEGTVLAAIGGLAGIVAAALYASLLLDFLSGNWPGEERLTFLRFHGDFHSFVHGYLAALIVSMLTMLWATRVLAKVSPKSLLSGETIPARATTGRLVRWPLSLIIACQAAVGALACLVAGFIVSGHEAQAGSFFGSGAFVLTALFAVFWLWMRRTQHKTLALGGLALTRLGVRNASRHPVRSMLTVGLLASATFLVVAVQSFHRNPGADFYDRNAGSGGFRLLAEADVPLFQDLNSKAGRKDLFFPKKVPDALDDVAFYPFRVRAGDDASCLNLYQPLKPRILGVPPALVSRSGFRFQSGLWENADERADPWLLLEGKNDNAIPVFADATTAKYTLHVGLGETLETTDDEGKKRTLRIVGLLQESIFQSELLMADADFKQLFPRQEGFAFFLLDTPPERAEAVKSALERANAALFVTPTAKRLESYLAVENTYLATFQALGGLGLLLGALGLAVVLLRSVWERRGELALLRALGFRRRALSRLVLAENGFLLVLGLGVGTISALLAVTPHLLGMGGELDWLPLIGLLALVLLVGLGAAALAVAATLRAPLLTALRRE
jgi:ABC-type lipoprotein release transport system permease subunit